MDKRSLLALFLIAIVIVGGSLLTPREPMQVTPVDSVATPATALRDSLGATSPQAPVRAPAPVVSAPTDTTRLPAAPAPIAIAETTTVTAEGRVMRFVTAGAVPAAVTLPDYQDLKRRDGPIALRAIEGPLMRYRIVSGTDTVSFESVPFTRTQTGNTIEFAAASPAIRVRYQVHPENYLTRATVTMAGAAPDARLLIDLAPDLQSGDADEAEDLRNLAYGFRGPTGDVESHTITGLDSMQTIVEPGPIDWVAIRNKYFLFAVIAADSSKPFSTFAVRGGSPRAEKLPTGIATTSIPLADAAAGFDLYTGPQSWTTLRTVGRNLTNVNPYAWAWLRPVIEPFSTLVMRAVLGMKMMTGLSYGWVLVIFGIGVRLLLWPLNQGAMRTSIKMQRLQPEMAVINKKYAKDPEALRTAMMKLYADHGMSPFSPLMGCLPMLIPMPILFALYFVFQNTIEFRGVPFLWLPDISLMDPYFIMPILMAASMLVLSWIGMRGAPPNPQAKIMGYMMPVMFVMFFWKLASGLNMYYAVQNLVAIPQQWLLTQERVRATGGGAPKAPTAPKKR